MTRSHEHEIEIHAPVEDVWRALVDPEELARWFAPEAQVEPGPGGRVRLAWGEEMAGESRIVCWEPGRRLQLVSDPSDGQLPPPDEPVVEDYLLETRGGTTVLRLVHSGIPESSAWDGFYESTRRGWPLVLRSLRHYLERHPGKPRRDRFVMVPLALPREEAWDALTGPDGLGAGELPPAGERYAVTSPDGDRLEGQVLLHVPGRTLQLTVETLGDGLVALALDESASGTFAWVSVATFGNGDSEVADRLAARLHGKVAAVTSNTG
jgi:uncharacterized protein YndB with AHSA1/START domain